MVRRRSALAVAGFALAAAAGCSSGGATPAAGSTAAETGSSPALAQTSAAPFPTPAADGGSFNNADEIVQALQSGGVPCAQAQSADPSDYDALSYDECVSNQDSGRFDTEILVFSKRSEVLDYASANFVTGDPQTVVLAGVDWAIETPPDYASRVQDVLGGTLYTADPEASPSHTGAPEPEQVTYRCTGHGSVDITYGANGSSHSASRLPFNRVEPLTDGALYYVTTAQLQGSGSVSCTTTVQTDNLDGSADDVSNSGSADGGYNIASAEVCGGVGGWEKC